MSDDLAARIAEDEAAATSRLSWLPIEPKPDDWTRLMCDPVMGPFGGQTAVRDVVVGLYVGRMSDPARVLREVAAKRALLNLAASADRMDGDEFSNEQRVEAEAMGAEIIRILSAIYDA